MVFRMSKSDLGIKQYSDAKSRLKCGFLGLDIWLKTPGAKIRSSTVDLTVRFLHCCLSFPGADWMPRPTGRCWWLLQGWPRQGWGCDASLKGFQRSHRQILNLQTILSTSPYQGTTHLETCLLLTNLELLAVSQCNYPYFKQVPTFNATIAQRKANDGNFFTTINVQLSST